eukprot:70400_1
MNFFFFFPTKILLKFVGLHFIHFFLSTQNHAHNQNMQLNRETFRDVGYTIPDSGVNESWSTSYHVNESLQFATSITHWKCDACNKSIAIGDLTSIGKREISPNLQLTGIDRVHYICYDRNKQFLDDCMSNGCYYDLFEIDGADDLSEQRYEEWLSWSETDNNLSMTSRNNLLVSGYVRKKTVMRIPKGIQSLIKQFKDNKIYWETEPTKLIKLYESLKMDTGGYPYQVYAAFGPKFNCDSIGFRYIIKSVQWKALFQLHMDISSFPLNISTFELDIVMSQNNTQHMANYYWNGQTYEFCVNERRGGIQLRNIVEESGKDCDLIDRMKQVRKDGHINFSVSRFAPVYCNMATQSNLIWTLNNDEITKLKTEIKTWGDLKIWKRKRGVLKIFKDWKLEFMMQKDHSDCSKTFLCLMLWTTHFPAYNIGIIRTKYSLNISTNNEDIISFDGKADYRPNRYKDCNGEPLNPSICHRLDPEQFCKANELCIVLNIEIVGLQEKRIYLRGQWQGNVLIPETHWKKYGFNKMIPKQKKRVFDKNDLGDNCNPPLKQQKLG